MSHFDPVEVLSLTVGSFVPIMLLKPDFPSDIEAHNSEWRLLADTSSLIGLKEKNIE